MNSLSKKSNTDYPKFTRSILIDTLSTLRENYSSRKNTSMQSTNLFTVELMSLELLYLNVLLVIKSILFIESVVIDFVLTVDIWIPKNGRKIL